MRPMFGQVKQFLSFNWRNQEEIWVAVIQGWRMENWFEDAAVGEGLHQLRKSREWLDAVEVTALEAMIGRIKVKVDVGEEEIVFEATSGCLKAEMF